MRRAMAWSLALVGALGATHARADDTSDLQATLDEPVVTSASHTAQTATNAPATTTTITAEDLRRWGITSLDQALDFLSLGVVTSNPLHQVDVGARGVMISKDQGNHFLLLVNGHVMNEPLFGSARFERGAGIPIETIDHIEVVLGPGSVLYGSNAMLGVINVVTKRAKDWKGFHLVGETELGKSYRFGTGFGLAFPLLGEPSELTLQVEGYRQLGPAFTYGPQDKKNDIVDALPERFDRNGPRTGIWGGVARQSYQSTVPALHLRFLRGGFELNFLASSYKRGVPFVDSRNRSAGSFDDPESYEVDRSLRLDLSYRRVLSKVVQLAMRLYGDSFDSQRYGIETRTGGCLYVGTVDCKFSYLGVSRWGGLEVRPSFDWREDGSFVTILGVDARRSFVAYKQDIADLNTGRYLESSGSVIHAHDGILGAYLQQSWRPNARFDLNGGVRIDAGEQFKPVASPRLAASIQTWRGGALKLVYATAFRAPSWFERATSEVSTILARDLRPERVRSIEASIEQKLSTHRLLFGGFYTRWTDLIELHILSGTEASEAARRGEINYLRAGQFKQYRNVASIESWGFNALLEGSGLTGALRYGLNVTGAMARRIDDAGNALPLTVAPAFFGNARVAWVLPGDLPTFGLAMHYVGRRLADRAYDGEFHPLPHAPPLLEARATVSGNLPIVKGLSYRVIAQYAFATRGPYVVGPVQGIDVPDGLYDAELSPIDRFRVTLGLRYDLGGDAR